MDSAARLNAVTRPLGSTPDEPRAHRFEDQVPEGLQVGEVLALVLHVLLELAVGSARAPATTATARKTAAFMNTVKSLRARCSRPGRRLSIGTIVRPSTTAHVEDAAEPADDKAARPGEDEAGGHHGEHVERDEDRPGAAARGDDGA